MQHALLGTTSTTLTPVAPEESALLRLMTSGIALLLYSTAFTSMVSNTPCMRAAVYGSEPPLPRERLAPVTMGVMTELSSLAAAAWISRVQAGTHI